MVYVKSHLCWSHFGDYTCHNFDFSSSPLLFSNTINKQACSNNKIMVNFIVSLLAPLCSGAWGVLLTCLHIYYCSLPHTQHVLFHNLTLTHSITHSFTYRMSGVQRSAAAAAVVGCWLRIRNKSQTLEFSYFVAKPFLVIEFWNIRVLLFNNCFNFKKGFTYLFHST